MEWMSHMSTGSWQECALPGWGSGRRPGGLRTCPHWPWAPSVLNNPGNIYDRGDLKGLAIMNRHGQPVITPPPGNIGRTLFSLVWRGGGDVYNATMLILQILSPGIMQRPHIMNWTIEEAQIFHKALDLNQSFALAWNNLGNVHVMRGEYDKAFFTIMRPGVWQKFTQACRHWALLFASGKYCDSAKAFEELLR